MEEKQLVSVIIPTYKQWEVLPRAIDSVLAQTYKNIEIIVIDDNNPDSVYRANTEKIMLEYRDNAKIKYIKHEKNSERSAARNTGIKSSKGEFIMFLDNDDEFLETKVASQVQCLNSRTCDWGICYTRYLRKNDNKVIAYCGETREGNLLIEGLKRNLFIHAGSNLMIRREVIDKVGGFDESISANEDIEFLVRALKKYKLAFVNVIGLIVNVHSRGIVDLENITQRYIDKINYHLSDISKEEQNNVHELLALQLLRHNLFSKKDFHYLFLSLKTKKIKVKNIIKYTGYLLWRRITKKSYGFKQ